MTPRIRRDSGRASACGQAEHPARVRQPHGQHLGAGGPQGPDGPGEGLAGPLGVEARPQRVVDADDDGGDVGLQGERRRKLVPLDVRGLRAKHREVVQFRVGQACRPAALAQPRQPPSGAGSPMPMVIESPRVTIRVMLLLPRERNEPVP